jgi:hypothetical protein
VSRGRRDSSGSGKVKQQVPHRAFGPVRNDKGFGVGLRSAEALLHPTALYAALERRSFTVVLAAVECPVRSDGIACRSCFTYDLWRPACRGCVNKIKVPALSLQNAAETRTGQPVR